MSLSFSGIIGELQNQLHHLRVLSKYYKETTSAVIPELALARSSIAYDRAWNQDELYKSICVLEKIQSGVNPCELEKSEHYDFERAINYMKDIVYVSKKRVAELEGLKPEGLI